MDEEPTRRALLAATGAGAATASTGCFSSLRSRVVYTPAEQVSLSVKSVPADRDPTGTAIARSLRDGLEAVGVDATLEFLSAEQLLRDSLLNDDFDCAVVRLPGHAEPDELRCLLHSVFAEEEGWQNPAGYANREVDRLLERQRRPVGDRADALADVQRHLHSETPIAPVASPTHLGVLGEDLDGPEAGGLDDPLAFLQLDPPGDRLRVRPLHAAATVNRNLLGVEFRSRDRLLELLYDPPLRRVDGEYVPWLARSWRRTEEGVQFRLRPDHRWHDGEPVTAEDVAFTYEFLSDTALGGADSAVPAPRFRSQSSLVEGVTVRNRETVRLHLSEVREELLPHVLTVPVLPAHRWRERAALERQYLTRAIVENVEEPVGSGPLAFRSAEPEQSMTLERYDDHFLRGDAELSAALEPFRGGPEYEELVADPAANASTAISDVGADRADVVDGSLPPELVADARATPGVRVVEEPTRSYYAVLFNARRPPLSHYGFRRAAASLIDREHVVETVFGGYATPTVSPLVGTDLVPSELPWSDAGDGADGDDGSSDAQDGGGGSGADGNGADRDGGEGDTGGSGTDAVDGEDVRTFAVGEFPGEDGELDVEAARARFRAAGFRYHEGDLLARQ